MLGATLDVDDDTGINNGVSPFATVTAAMAAASNGDIINITGGADNIHQEQFISVTKSLTFQGQGQSTTILQAAASAGAATNVVFYLQGGSNQIITFKDMTIRYGVTNNSGAGVHIVQSATSDVTFTNVTLTENNSHTGGAIGTTGSGGKLTMTNCVVSDNDAIQNGGGGILLQALVDATFTNCTFRDNTAKNSGFAIEAYNPSLVFNYTFTNCTVYNNNGALTNPGNNGAFRMVGAVGSVLNISNCTFANNIFTAASSSSRGGGLFLQGATLNMTKTIFANNGPSAVDGDDIYFSSDVIVGTNDANIVMDCAGTGCPTWLSTADPNLQAVATCGEQSYLEPNTGSAAINPTSTSGISTDICGFTRNQGNIDVGSKEAGATTTVSSDWSPLGLGVNNQIEALAIDGNGNVYAGGTFTAAGGTAASNIAMWDGTSWSSLGSGVNNTVFSIVIDASNNVYVGGSFTTAGGATANRIAKWDGSAWSTLGTGFNDRCLALAMSGTDIYAGGDFGNAGGTSVSKVAKWDGSAWSALGTGLNNRCEVIAISGSDVYFGGHFSSAGGNAAAKVAKWDGSAWSALGTGLSGTAYSMAVSGSNIYIGGDFTTAGGVTANRIAKWDGSTWSAIGVGFNTICRSIGVSGNEIYAGGPFDNTSNNSGGARYISKWDGTSWSNLGTGLNANWVYAISILGNDLYAAGIFTKADGIPMNNIAKWSGVSVAAPTATIGAGTVEVCHNDNVEVPVTIADGDGVATISMKIAFDKTKFTYVQANNLHASLNNGNLIMSSAAVANAAGEITIAWYNTTNVNFGAASLFDLEFTGTAVGNSALTWSTSSPYGELSDENGNVITSSYTDGSATVNAKPVIQNFAVQGGGLTGCASAASPLTLELDGSETGVDYQLQKDGVDEGSTVSGTGSAITFNVTAAGSYTVVATNTTTNCTEDMSGTVVVTDIPTAFNVTGGGDYCPSGAAIAIGLDGSETGVNYKLTLSGATIETVAGTGSAIAFTPVTTTNASGDVYTVIAEATANTACTETMTGSATVTLVCFDITGTYRYGANGGDELKNFTATLKDNGGATVSTHSVGINGQFTFTNVPNGTGYYIEADLSGKPHGGINAIDALLMARHFAALQILSSGLYEDAGDVNSSSSVNAADALATLTRFVGNTTSFTSGDWLTEYDGASTNTGMQAFDVSGANVGLNDVLVLAYGDVNASYDVSGLSNGSKSIINLILEDEIIVEENATINIPFYTMTNMEVGAISIVMNYPFDVFDIASIQLNDKVQASGLNYTIENGRVRLGWFNLAGVQLEAGEELFSITGQVHADLSAAYQWTPTITFGNETELGDKAGNPIEIVDLTAPAIVLPIRTVLQSSENFTQHLYPNPSTTQTNLEYNLPVEAAVTFELYNAVGTQIRVLAKANQANGIYTLLINTADLQSGLYMIRTTVTSASETKVYTKQLMIAH